MNNDLNMTIMKELKKINNSDRNRKTREKSRTLSTVMMPH